MRKTLHSTQRGEEDLHEEQDTHSTEEDTQQRNTCETRKTVNSHRKEEKELQEEEDT